MISCSIFVYNITCFKSRALGSREIYQHFRGKPSYFQRIEPRSLPARTDPGLQPRPQYPRIPRPCKWHEMISTRLSLDQGTEGVDISVMKSAGKLDISVMIYIYIFIFLKNNPLNAICWINDTLALVVWWRRDQSHESHNALVPYATMHHSDQKCAHFSSG